MESTFMHYFDVSLLHFKNRQTCSFLILWTMFRWYAVEFHIFTIRHSCHHVFTIRLRIHYRCFLFIVPDAMRQDSKLLLLNKVSIQSNECIDEELVWKEKNLYFSNLTLPRKLIQQAAFSLPVNNCLFFSKLKPSYDSWDEKLVC